MNIWLIILSVLPVAVLLLYVYLKDKYEREPLGLLALSFFGGVLAILLTLLLVPIFQSIIYSDSLFYSAFVEAAIPEELSKFTFLFLLIWRNKHFDEYFDGIVYAVFVGLGFACVENITYVVGQENFEASLSTGIVRALLSVPAHFLFAVIMGYFFSMAKFNPGKRIKYLFFSIFFAILAHGIFDIMLMFTDYLNANNMATLGIIIYLLFLYFDFRMWKIGLKYIERHIDKSAYKNIKW